MICIQCTHRIRHGHGVCPNCGRPAETIPGPPWSRRRRAAARRQPFMLDARFWTSNDRIVGVASAALLISLYLPWFSVNPLGVTIAELDALTSHRYLHIVLYMCIAILVYLVLRISPIRRVLPRPRAHDRLLLAATAVNFVIVLIGFIKTPGNADWAPWISREYGAIAGAVAALAAVAPLAASAINLT